VSLAPHILVAQLPVGGAGTLVALDAATTHHLRRTLRLVEGAELSLTDGVGGHAPARLAPDGAVLTAAVEREVRVPPTLTLVQSLSKGRRAEDAVRMACELGVDRVVPLVAERTQGRPDAAARRRNRPGQQRGGFALAQVAADGLAGERLVTEGSHDVVAHLERIAERQPVSAEGFGQRHQIRFDA
jgi:hypothetical protein